MNIYQRINEVLSEGKALEKTGKMQGAGGNYAFHQTDELLAFLRPLLVQHGIHFSYSVVEHHCELKTIAGKHGERQERETIKHVNCRLTNVEEPSEFVEGIEVGYGLDSQDKGPGKATSYAVKTWLLNVFMLRGQPDEEKMEKFDGYIGGEDLEEIQSLIEETNSDLKGVLKVAKADRVEHILLSRLGIVRNLLRDKLTKIKAKEAGQ